jgi:hypothetical protein
MPRLPEICACRRHGPDTLVGYRWALRKLIIWKATLLHTFISIKTQLVYHHSVPWCRAPWNREENLGTDPNSRICKLDNGSCSGSGSCSFRRWLWRCKQKFFVFFYIHCLLFFFNTLFNTPLCWRMLRSYPGQLRLRHWLSDFLTTLLKMSSTYYFLLVYFGQCANRVSSLS